MSSSLTSAVTVGAWWAAGGSLVMRFGNIALTAVVARILAPHDVGVFTLAVTLHGVLTSVAELGFASAAARSDLDQKKIEPTVASIAVLTSLTLGILVELFAGPLAAILGDAESEASIRILALGIALIGPFAVPGAILQRKFRQDVVFKASAIAFLPGSLLLVVLASCGFGAASFAWSRILGQLIMGLVMVKATGWPSLQIQRDLIGPLFAFGLPLATANLVSQVLLNADNVVIAHVLSTEAVGLFGIAFNVASWPAAVIGTVLNGMVLPAISRVVRDGGDLLASLRQGVFMVATVSFPVAAFTGFFAHPLLTVIYGPRWAGASQALAFLSVYSSLFVIGLLLANAVVALGHTGSLLMVQILALVLLVPSLILGAYWAGLAGVAASHTLIIAGATMPAYLLVAKRLTGFGLLDLIRSLTLPALRAVAAAVIAWIFTIGMGDFMKLVLGLLVFSVVYVVLARRALFGMLPEKLARRFYRALRLNWEQQ